MLPEKRIFLFVLIPLILIIAGLLVFNFLLSRYGLFWQRPALETNQETKPAFPPTPAVTALSSKIGSPVSKGFLVTALISNAASDHLVFKLPLATEVLAVFGGTVARVVESAEFENIQLKGEEGLVASYLVVGEVLVKEGIEVKEGEVLAKIKEGPGPGCLSGGNLGLYLLDAKGNVSVKKEMLKE